MPGDPGPAACHGALLPGLLDVPPRRPAMPRRRCQMTDITILNLQAGTSYGASAVSDRVADLQRVVVLAHDGDTQLSIHLTSAEQARALSLAFIEAAGLLEAVQAEALTA